MTDPTLQDIKEMVERERSTYEMNTTTYDVMLFDWSWVAGIAGKCKTIHIRDIPREKVAETLFDLSLTHYVSAAFINHYPFELQLRVEECHDSKTNIDADLIEFILELKDEIEMNRH